MRETKNKPSLAARNRNKSTLHRVLHDVDRACLCGGLGTFLFPSSMDPMVLRANNVVSEFDRGAAGMALSIWRIASESVEGRMALRDLGFKPFFDGKQSKT